MNHLMFVKVDPQLVDNWDRYRLRVTLELKRTYPDLRIKVHPTPMTRWDTPTISVRCSDPNRDVVRAVEIASEPLQRRMPTDLLGYNDVRIGNGSYWIAPNSSWLEDPTRWFGNGSDDDYKPTADPVMGLRL